MTLGAIRNDSLIYQTGKAVAIQYKRAGININLAPAANVNNDPQNPLINYESFGEDPENVSRKTLIYLNGLLDNGIISVAKHFHGRDDADPVQRGAVIIIIWFGNPYAVDGIKSLKDADGLVLAYEENEFTEDISAQMIFGGIGALGILPVTINEIWPYDSGIITPGDNRMQYGLPENAGMSSVLLEEKIDSIVSVGLTVKAFPGCEVMVARYTLLCIISAIYN